jgi:hypothetical protein
MEIVALSRVVSVHAFTCIIEAILEHCLGVVRSSRCCVMLQHQHIDSCYFGIWYIQYIAHAYEQTGRRTYFSNAGNLPLLHLVLTVKPLSITNRIKAGLEEPLR